MKRFLKIIGYCILTIVLLIISVFAWVFISAKLTSRSNLSTLGPVAGTIVQDGMSFRDLNKNGKLDISMKTVART